MKYSLSMMDAAVSSFVSKFVGEKKSEELISLDKLAVLSVMVDGFAYAKIGDKDVKNIRNDKSRFKNSFFFELSVAKLIFMNKILSFNLFFE